MLARDGTEASCLDGAEAACSDLGKGPLRRGSPPMGIEDARSALITGPLEEVGQFARMGFRLGQDAEQKLTGDEILVPQFANQGRIGLDLTPLE